MLYFIMMIFVKPGKEAVFHEFEELAIPLLAEHGGRLIYRLRPTDDSYISSEEERPYEIHFLSFASEEAFRSFAKDPRRASFVHLRDESIRESYLIKGQKL